MNFRKELNTFCVISFVLMVPLIWMLVRASNESSRIPPEPVDQQEESIDWHSDGFEGERSSQWRKVRDAYVHEHPECAACGSHKDLNVHHILPFHTNPELELDMTNFITLCREHHFKIGHDPDGIYGPAKPAWDKCNLNVVIQAAEFRMQVEAH